jgi:RNA polymerase sigma-54 factor
MNKMGMGMDLTMRPDQRMVLAPRMIQSMEILQLPIMSLLERIQEELEKNPVLELKEPVNEDATPAETDFAGTESLPPDKPADPDRDELVIEENGGNELDFDRLEALSRDYDDYLSEEHRPSRSTLDEEGDKKHDAMQNMASRPVSLQDHLNEQAGFLDLADDEARLLRHIVSYVDQTGYLGIRVLVRRDPDEGDTLYIAPEQARVLSHVLEYVEKTGYLGLRIIVREEPKIIIEDTKDEKKLKEIKKALKEQEKEREKDKEIFVPVTLKAIAESYDKPVSEEEVEDILGLVQKLDPPGVAARDLRECLLLQVTEETPHSEVVRTLLENHLEDIEHNRLPYIQQKTGYDLALIKEAIEVIRHLNPRPGAEFAPDTNRYVVPDVSVERKDDGTYEIKLLDDWVPEVHISSRYVAMCKDRNADKDTREYLKKKIQDAMWLRESIEQRRSTLEKVSRAIIERQKPFLDRGPEHIQPLKMQEIADQIEVHVTTVSRAVDDKWIQTPRGVFPLKRFFGGGKEKTDTHEVVAWEVIKQKLLEIIDNEDKSNPLSDEDLVNRLQEVGYPVARRTVTKYRKMLKIPSSRQRKDWTLVTSRPATTPAPETPTVDTAAE